MIKVSVLYPGGQDIRFDMDYYLKKHTPMVREKLGAALKQVEIDQGLSGAQPGSAPAYLVLCHLHFDSVAAFQSAFAPVADAILSDIANYTNTQPVIQISESKV
jgi:uncharacterized protein (TIGR02118 family)